MSKERIEFINELSIYNKVCRKFIKHIRENYNGSFQRIQFADSTKIVVEYYLDNELKTVELTYEELGIK